MNYQDINDYELVYLLADNSEDYVPVVIEKYAPLIQKTIRKWKILIRQVALDSEDLEQELYYTLILAAQDYDASMDCTFYTYLLNRLDYRIHELLRPYKKEERKIIYNTIPLNTRIGEEFTLEDSIQDPNALIEDYLIEKYVRQSICNFLYHLNIQNAEVLELYLNGYEITNISILLSYPKRRITEILYRIRKRLEKYLLEKQILGV